MVYIAKDFPSQKQELVQNFGCTNHIPTVTQDDRKIPQDNVKHCTSKSLHHNISSSYHQNIVNTVELGVFQLIKALLLLIYVLLQAAPRVKFDISDLWFLLLY